MFDLLDAARDPDRTADLAAAFAAPGVVDELARLRALAGRFGLRTLEGVAFGTGPRDVAVSDRTYLYAPAPKTGAMTLLPVGPAQPADASPDGARFAFAACGSPCGGLYPLHFLDVATRKVVRTTSLSVHDYPIAWTKSGASVLVHGDESRTGPTRGCAGVVTANSGAYKRLACVGGVNTGFAISPARTAFALAGHAAVVAYRFDEASGSATEVARAKGHALHPFVDDQGRLAWTDNDAPDFHYRVHLLRSGEAPATQDDARFTGFLADGSLLLSAWAHPSMESPVSPSLGEAGRCGAFERRERLAPASH